MPALLVAVLLQPAAAVAGTAIGRAAQPAVALSGVVSASDGSPVAGATVTVSDQQFLTDDQGHWDGAVPFESRLREFVTAPGYVGRGYHDMALPSPNIRMPVLRDTLWSIFDPDAESYAREASAPPTVSDFTTNTGVSRSQEVPADTSSITVTGTVGQRDGAAVVRGDAYLGRPDDFVDQLAVTIQGATFSAVFPITHGAGVYRVEINDTTGAAVINVPVFVGVPYAAEGPIWPEAADLEDDGPTTRALEALQEIRQTHGLPPYAVDARLAKVAQDHVDDMVAHHWACHCWSDGTSVEDHVRAAGIEPALIPVPGVAGPVHVWGRQRHCRRARCSRHPRPVHQPRPSAGSARHLHPHRPRLRRPVQRPQLQTVDRLRHRTLAPAAPNLGPAPSPTFVPPPPPPIQSPFHGALAQRESTCLAGKGSGVRIPDAPPDFDLKRAAQETIRGGSPGVLTTQVPPEG